MKAESITRGLLVLAFSLAAFAQGPAASNDADSPNRTVARISVLQGAVSVRRGDSGDAVAAAINAPLSATDRLLSGEASRAEIQFDALNMIRLAPMTEVRIGELAYHQYQIDVATGTTVFRVRRDNDAQIEISTPSVALRPLKEGVYRVTVKADGTSEITVRSGAAEISSPKGTVPLEAGKTMEARGPADDPEFQVVNAIAPDEWDRWNVERDRVLERSTSGRYVNPDIDGTEELDANGRWVNDPAYGQVWVPAVDPGWAPYQVGRWVWVDYYGWTWVSGDPWGWAPYHYGRWYMSSYGWAWWPGAITGPYYWRPALVGFFGWGGVGIGVGAGFGFANVGWVALAPYERFNAWYGPGMYGHGFGAVSVARLNVTNIYRNARVSNGVVSMSASQFGRTGVNAATNIRASAGDLARAGAVRGAVAIAPSRESTHFTDRAASAGAMPHSDNSHFYSSRAASSASHLSFDQQRQAMTRSVASMAARNAASSAATRPAASAGSMNRGGVSSGSSAVRPAPGTSQAGWQRFSGNNSASGNSGSSSSSANRSQAVRINPSVVQSRTSSSGRGASRGGGGRR